LALPNTTVDRSTTTPLVSLICRHCSAEYQSPPKGAPGYRVTCSDACRRAHALARHRAHYQRHGAEENAVRKVARAEARARRKAGLSPELPKRLRGPANSRAGKAGRQPIYGQPIVESRVARPIPSLPRVLWLERPDPDELRRGQS
jgi:hypothetical protein